MLATEHLLPTPCSLTTCPELEISHRGRIYTLEISERYKSRLFPGRVVIRHLPAPSCILPRPTHPEQGRQAERQASSLRTNAPFCFRKMYQTFIDWLIFFFCPLLCTQAPSCLPPPPGRAVVFFPLAVKSLAELLWPLEQRKVC